MGYDLVIEGRLLTEKGTGTSYICIKDGIISEVTRSRPGHDCPVKRYPGCLLLPGCIDSHVHFRDPGLTHKEDFGTGSLSAAFGGVTSVLDMPNTKPPTLDIRSLMEKATIAKERSYIDYGLYLGITRPSNVETVLERLRESSPGLLPKGLKAFLGESTGSLIFKPIEDIAQVLEGKVRGDLPVSVHAEDGDKISLKDEGEERGDKGSLAQHLRSRPSEAEVSAIDRVLKVAGMNKASIHFLHVSSKEGIGRVGDSGATIEVTPHHLLLDIKWCESELELEALAKVNPPVRNTSDRAALWDALLSGRVRCIGSDHAPHILSEKEVGGQAPSGMPGTETMLPLLFHEFHSRKLDLRPLQKVLCEGPAERFGLQRKGHLRPGDHADIVGMDPKEVRKVRSEDLHSKCGWTAFEGFNAVFPRIVYSRGELLVEDGNICSRQGRGTAL